MNPRAATAAAVAAIVLTVIVLASEGAPPVDRLAEPALAVASPRPPGAAIVQLATSSLSASKIKAHVPQGGSLPRGFYMCFAVTNSGIPSVARWVKVL